jgi:hypothetical protein
MVPLLHETESVGDTAPYLTFSRYYRSLCWKWGVVASQKPVKFEIVSGGVV